MISSTSDHRGANPVVLPDCFASENCGTPDVPRESRGFGVDTAQWSCILWWTSTGFELLLVTVL